MNFSRVSSHRVVCRKCGKLSPFDAGCPCQYEGCAPGKNRSAGGICFAAVLAIVVVLVAYAIAKGIPS